VGFKLAVMVLKALSDLAPQYLSDDCQLAAVSGRHYRIQSSVSFKRSFTSTSSHLSDRAFSAAGPRIWNSLPTQVHHRDLSLDSFYRKLKTYFVVQGTSA